MDALTQWLSQLDSQINDVWQDYLRSKQHFEALQHQIEQYTQLIADYQEKLAMAPSCEMGRYRHQILFIEQLKQSQGQQVAQLTQLNKQCGRQFQSWQGLKKQHALMEKRREKQAQLQNIKLVRQEQKQIDELAQRRSLFGGGVSF